MPRPKGGGEKKSEGKGGWGGARGRKKEKKRDVLAKIFEEKKSARNERKNGTKIPQKVTQKREIT